MWFNIWNSDFWYSDPPLPPWWMVRCAPLRQLRLRSFRFLNLARQVVRLIQQPCWSGRRWRSVTNKHKQ